MAPESNVMEYVESDEMADDEQQSSLDDTQQDRDAARDDANRVVRKIVPRGDATGGQWHEVREGECVSSIATQFGHLWSTIWDHAANAALREMRPNANILLEGDWVFVPDMTPKQENGEAESRHRFVRLGEPVMVRVQIADDDLPRSNQPFSADLGGTTVNGTSDPDGWLSLPVPRNCSRAVITMGPDDATFVLNLGECNPIDELTGVQDRLENLGFDCGHEYGRMTADLRQALCDFQVKHELEQSGKADDATRAKLVEVHGS